MKLFPWILGIVGFVPALTFGSNKLTRMADDLYNHSVGIQIWAQQSYDGTDASNNKLEVEVQKLRAQLDVLERFASQPSLSQVRVKWNCLDYWFGIATYPVGSDDSLDSRVDQKNVILNPPPLCRQLATALQKKYPTLSETIQVGKCRPSNAPGSSTVFLDVTSIRETGYIVPSSQAFKTMEACAAAAEAMNGAHLTN